MTHTISPGRRSIRLIPGFFALSALLSSCDSSKAPTYLTGNPDGVEADSSTPPPAPVDTATGDSIPGTGGDSLPPPPDSTAPVITPVHVGIPFGPYALPPALYGQEFNGAYRPRWRHAPLLADLEAARRANTRVVLNFTGSERYLSDEHGFSFAKWKQRVDLHRGIDFTSYIADGTIIGHFIMDEPDDPSNWHGKQVSVSDIEEMAKYSKEIWPSMPTIIRVTPDYFKGHRFQYLDAAWAQYLDRFGPLDAFITNHIREAQESGLALVGGLNVLNGGSKSSSIPGRKVGKNAMSASEIRTWGGAILDQPHFCAFIMWEYDQSYFSRPDIKAALADLKKKAESHPKKACVREP
jgi:hypothetical protein